MIVGFLSGSGGGRRLRILNMFTSQAESGDQDKFVCVHWGEHCDENVPLEGSCVGKPGKVKKSCLELETER